MSNTLYNSFISVVVSCDDHEQCLSISRLVTKLCDAWSLCEVRYDEHKVQKTKPVTNRKILIYQTGYSHNVIIFRESLNCILSHFIFIGKATMNCTMEPVQDGLNARLF